MERQQPHLKPNAEAGFTVSVRTSSFSLLFVFFTFTQKTMYVALYLKMFSLAMYNFMLGNFTNRLPLKIVIIYGF